MSPHYFPNALIGADRFHVVRLVNHHLLKLWKEHDPDGRVNRGLISLMRRHAWHLKPAQEYRLTQYLEAFPVLHALYLTKQRLMRFLVLKTLTAKRAKKRLPRFLALLRQLAHSPRPEERRVGKECCSTGRSRWSPEH